MITFKIREMAFASRFALNRSTIRLKIDNYLYKTVTINCLKCIRPTFKLFKNIFFIVLSTNKNIEKLTSTILEAQNIHIKYTIYNTLHVNLTNSCMITYRNKIISEQFTNYLQR